MVKKTAKSKKHSVIVRSEAILLSADEYKNGGLEARRAEVELAVATHDFFYDELRNLVANITDYSDDALAALGRMYASDIMKYVKVGMEEAGSGIVTHPGDPYSFVAVFVPCEIDGEGLVRALVGKKKAAEAAV